MFNAIKAWLRPSGDYYSNQRTLWRWFYTLRGLCWCCGETRGRGGEEPADATG